MYFGDFVFSTDPVKVIGKLKLSKKISNDQLTQVDNVVDACASSNQCDRHVNCVLDFSYE